MRIQHIYIEDFDLNELYFTNPQGEIRGGVQINGIDYLFDPYTGGLLTGDIQSAEYLYSILDVRDIRKVSAVLDYLVGTLIFNLRKELP
jgi:hypothetical protein